jgi:uncharacterized membrane protein YgcG
MRRLLAVVALAALLVLPAGGTALAEPPFDVGGQVTDHAGVLNVEGHSQVNDALARLASDDGVYLYVVYVNSFDGAEPGDWADGTAVQSGLGDDDALFAVAVSDRVYGYWVPLSFPLSNADIDNLFAQEVVPELSAGNHAGAVVALAEGLVPDDASTAAPAPEGDAGVGNDESEDISAIGIIGGLAVVVAGLAAGVGVAYLLGRTRRRRQEPPPDEEPQRPEPPARVRTDEDPFAE